MTIPEGVNHHEFWKQAKLKGIKISSRYSGVYLKISTNGSPSWTARVQDEGNKKFKSFPFSEEGERLAAMYYIAHKKRAPLNSNP